MEATEFKESAQFIARRNVSARVVRVMASFDPNSGNLSVIYCTKGEPTDDDVEDCELTCAELIAEFPQIRTAETKCVSSEQCAQSDEEAVVFSKS
ncbi:MAG: hypothetical protein V7604_3807 [Hyphomicrobiales bacterium]|jgi:hypothetical protein